MSDELDALLDDAEDALTNLEELDFDLDGDGENDVVEALDDDQLESLLGNVDALVEVVDEVGDMIEAIDFSELPEAVDMSEVLEAIHVGEIPKAIREGDADDVVKLRQLLRAINLTELWSTANVRDLWRSKRNLDDAVDDVVNESEEGSLLEEAASSVSELTDDGEGESGDGDGFVDAGSDAVADVTDDVGDAAADAYGSMDLRDGDGFGLSAEDTQAYQTMIQRQALKGIDEFRDALLLTHEKFQQLYEFNREKMRRTDRATHSRNPTATSTMPVDRADVPSTIRYSTVPQETRLSTAPNRRRIYGPRFEQELERRRSESKSKSESESGSARADTESGGETDGR
ncbi:hypothetical protein [Halomontanus rarus]|uniref:hypothetical protein n=1 Tax=Halomontanus rarus TaxID=3034020 RepID=UPI001A98D269